MKKILMVCLLGASSLAFAHGPYGHHYHRHGGWHWAPLVTGAIAGAVVYDIYNRPVVVQPPVVVQQPVVVQSSQNCTPWTETLNSDGTITRTRTCTQ